MFSQGCLAQNEGVANLSYFSRSIGFSLHSCPVDRPISNLMLIELFTEVAEVRHDRFNQPRRAIAKNRNDICKIFNSDRVGVH